MGADMLTATIATPASVTDIDYDAGRRLIAQLTTIDEFTLDEPYSFEDIVDQVGSDPAVLVTYDPDEQPSAEVIHHIGRTLIDTLEEALASRETTILHIAGFHVYLSAGLSWGDPPTEAATAIWNAHALPPNVLEAMGFTTLPA